MDIFESYQKLKSIEKLAKLKATGIPRELANRLDISERSLYRMIGYLKESGTAITYSRKQRSYILSEESDFSSLK